MPNDLKTKYKWIRFEKSEASDEWHCINLSGQFLGFAYYKNGWRQYVFNVETSAFEQGIDFNFNCLENIADFLKQLNKTKGCYKVK